MDEEAMVGDIEKKEMAKNSVKSSPSYKYERQF